MRKITFDIETTNTFSEVGSNNPADLEIALVAIHDSDSGEYSSYLKEDLPRLWPIIERADILIGYNSDHFDIPLLNVLYPGDLTQIRSNDIFREIRAVLGRRLKLDSVAEGTLGKKKIGHGLQSIEWWHRGEIEKVRKYCIEDVRITKELYDYARTHQNLKYMDHGKVVSIPLDTSSWEEATHSSVNQTLF